jgi:biopolymer transport protein ExbD
MELKAQGAGLDANVLVPRKPMDENAEFDITAMVDLVFMMNIFFLVTWVGASMTEIDLPAARHCMAADTDMAVIVTVTESGNRQGPAVVIGESGTGRALTDPSEIEQMVRAEVEKGVRAGKDTVLIKAEKRLRVRDVAGVASAAGGVEGVKLRLAVMEKE